MNKEIGETKIISTLKHIFGNPKMTDADLILVAKHLKDELDIARNDLNNVYNQSGENHIREFTKQWAITD